MELKNVLHYYLGCECERTWYYASEPTTLHSKTIVIVDGNLIDNPIGTSSSNIAKNYELKLILRPLSDMTRKEWDDNWTEFSVGVGNAVQSGYLGYSDKPKHVLVLENRLRTNTLTFNDGMILLRMGFDLFGLIESGRAIAKQLSETEKR